ncbi:MAG: hypothetical protein ABJC13_07020 [Acidobacteriota bacterium]
MKPRAPVPFAGLFLAALLGAACGKNGGSPTSPPPPNPAITRANVIAALFLGEGPLRAAQGATCLDTGIWRAFPRGSRIRVRLSTALSNGERNNIDGFLADFRGLIAGAYQLVIETTPEEDPIPGLLEVTNTSLNDAGVDAFCRPGTGGCAKYVFQAPGILAGSRTVARHQFGGNVHNHELVHGILGVCHLDGFQMPDALMTNPNSSSVGTLNGAERQAIQAVMRSGLSGGATRADFERLGLIDPAGTSGTSGTLSSPGFGAGGGADDPPILRKNRREGGGAAVRERERQ